RAPSFISTPMNNSNFNESDQIQITVSADDPDNDPVSYLIKIDGVQVSTSSSYNWTTNYSSSGHHNIYISVTDGINSVSENTIIIVNNVNRAPSFISTPMNNSNFNESDQIQITVSADDPDNDPVSYLIKIDGVQVSTSSSYNWTTNYSSTGYHYIYVSVTDGMNSVYSTITVYINKVLSNLTATNLMKNPGFESGTTSWVFHTGGAGTLAAVSPGYGGTTKASKLTLNSRSTNIQLYQTGVTLEPNTSYRLSFAAKSSSGHDLTVYLHKHLTPYTNYGLSYKADLSTSWQTFSTDFTSSGFTDTVNDGRLRFWLAPFAVAGDTYYIDDVQLEKIT
ncbi:MAG TPA: carbohydrate binding domain-containing protein, partial [candidate division Zixibacteria bacterium]|nr:carbohydrate binding domain-containing protein [candidate division Zixibacteria bacterium]